MPVGVLTKPRPTRGQPAPGVPAMIVTPQPTTMPATARKGLNASLRSGPSLRIRCAGRARRFIH